MQQDIEELKPCVPFYGPCNVRDLVAGEIKYWCRCGLSTNQPWCDGKSHLGTGFKPLKWVVPKGDENKLGQTFYSICNCKYTKSPPLCDATHNHLPLQILHMQAQCQQDHSKTLCTNCGFSPLYNHQ